MPFQSPGAGATAPGAGEFDVPAGRARCCRIMGGARRGHGRRRPARMAGGGGGIGPREGQDRCALARSRRQRQAPGGGEVGMRGFRIAQHGGNSTGLQSFLHGPQQARGLLQRDGHETVARQAEAFEAVAIEPTVLALMAAQAAPQQRAALACVAQPPERQGQCEAHGSWLVAIGTGAHVMQPRSLQPLHRQIAVEFGKPRQPGLGPAFLLLELRMPLLQPRDVGAQRVEQPRGVPALVMSGGAERSDGSASVSAPRSLMCRSNTHENNMIQNVPILFHRARTESSGTESQAGARLPESLRAGSAACRNCALPAGR